MNGYPTRHDAASDDCDDPDEPRLDVGRPDGPGVAPAEPPREGQHRKQHEHYADAAPQPRCDVPSQREARLDGSRLKRRMCHNAAIPSRQSIFLPSA